MGIYADAFCRKGKRSRMARPFPEHLRQLQLWVRNSNFRRTLFALRTRNNRILCRLPVPALHGKLTKDSDAQAFVARLVPPCLHMVH